MGSFRVCLGLPNDFRPPIQPNWLPFSTLTPLLYFQTIAAKGFKFMTTTEIAFCAMRMYSHFRRTEVQYGVLALSDVLFR